MKKQLALLCLCMTLLLPCKSYAAIYETPLPITANYNGNYIITDSAPQIINGRTLLPLRAAAEAISAEVSWDALKKQATIKKEDTTLIFTLNAKQFSKNGTPKALDVPLLIKNNRIYLPVRAFSEAFDVPTTWDNKRQIVELGQKPSYLNDESIPKNLNYIIDKYKSRAQSDDPLVGNWIASNQEESHLRLHFIHKISEKNYKIITAELLQVSDGNTIIDLYYATGVLSGTNLTINEDVKVQYAYGPPHGPQPGTTHYYTFSDNTLIAKDYIHPINGNKVDETLENFERLN